MSPGSIIGVVNPKELIPVNCTLLIPAVSIILKLEFVLFSLNGAWNMLLINRTPLPPVEPIPVTATPIDVKGYVVSRPSNDSEISSNSWLVV